MIPAVFFALLAVAGAVSLALSLGFTAGAMRVARRIGFVDHPAAGAHKSHREPIPYGGGTAIFLAFCVPVGLVLAATYFASERWVAESFGVLAGALYGGLRLRAAQASAIMTGGVALFLLGVRDDWKPLGPLVKGLVIAGVAVFVAWAGNVRIAHFAGEAGSIALTVVWIFVITNTFNFLDNMDGLSAGVAAICAAFLMICGIMAGQMLVPALAGVFLGSILGFLFFNFPPARIFMGDAGSLLIGYLLAVISVLTSYWESGTTKPAFALAMPLCVLAVPLYDFVSVVVIRLFEGRNPFRGDQRHFSHRLVDRGLNRRQAVLTIYLATATTGLCATLLPSADLRQTVTVLAIVVLVLCVVAILEMPLRREA
jgi:UDP-GlcNAc:undecaprenyl-phosphate GlcNAc-1-phosphate transferase